MPKPGMNIDPRNVKDPFFYLEPVHTWRFVLKPTDNVSRINGLIASAHFRKIEVIGVIARESYKPRWSHYTAARWYTNRYSVDYWQLGNEPDIQSPSSWTQTPKQYLNMFNRWSEYTGIIISPGLASGQTDWLNSLIDLGFDNAEWRALCYHQYSDNTLELYEQFDKYDNSLFITEWGFDTDNDHVQAELITRRLNELASLPSLEKALYFCASNRMVPNFGLTTEDEIPRESYAAYFNGVS